MQSSRHPRKGKGRKRGEAEVRFALFLATGSARSAFDREEFQSQPSGIGAKPLHQLEQPNKVLRNGSVLSEINCRHQ